MLYHKEEPGIRQAGPDVHLMYVADETLLWQTMMQHADVLILQKGGAFGSITNHINRQYSQNPLPYWTNPL